MDSQQSLHNFWSSFGLAAYDENTVKDNALDDCGAYITYSVSTGYFDEPTALSANIWYRSTSWKEITQKANEIGEEIGLGGKIVPFDDGAIWIKRGTPFAQRMEGDNDNVRRIYLNIEAEYISAE